MEYELWKVRSCADRDAAGAEALRLLAIAEERTPHPYRGRMIAELRASGVR